MCFPVVRFIYSDHPLGFKDQSSHVINLGGAIMTKDTETVIIAQIFLVSLGLYYIRNM